MRPFRIGLMPRKSRRDNVNESRLIAWYKWEFLRRNPDYQNDYKTFIEEFGGWFRQHGFWCDKTVRWNRAEFHFFAENIGPKAKSICERWQIRDPIPPHWEFSESGSFSYNGMSEVLLPTDCSDEAPGELWDPAEILPRGDDVAFAKNLPKSTAVVRQTAEHELRLVFDLRKPLPVLMRWARNRISSRQRAFARKNSAPLTTSPSVRRRLDVYSTYLKVWDLRAAGKTFAEIAKALFPGHLAATQRVVDSFYRAKELIEGGYKELR